MLVLCNSTMWRRFSAVTDYGWDVDYSYFQICHENVILLEVTNTRHRFSSMTVVFSVRYHQWFLILISPAYGVKVLFKLSLAITLGLYAELSVAKGLGVRTFLNFWRNTVIRALCNGSCGVCSLSRRSGVPPGDLIGKILLINYIKWTYKQ